MARKANPKSEKKPAKKKYVPTGNPIGKPHTYRRELADAVLADFEKGMSVTKACEKHGVPRGTFIGWAFDNKDGLFDRYSRAQHLNAVGILDDCFDIADDGTNDYTEQKRKDGSTFWAVNREVISRSDLRVRFRQWYAEKVMTGTLRMKKNDAGDEGTTVSQAAIEMLAKLAAGKAAQATHTIGGS